MKKIREICELVVGFAAVIFIFTLPAYSLAGGILLGLIYVAAALLGDDTRPGQLPGKRIP